MGMRGTQRSTRALVAAVALVASLSLPARPAVASAQYASDFGVGLGATLVNLVYMPVKVVYATLGGITGGLAFVLTGGNMDTATAVWRPSMGGSYVITPSMLRGEDPIYFSGSADNDTDRDTARSRDHDTRRDGY